jgi:hypothetical protein
LPRPFTRSSKPFANQFANIFCKLWTLLKMFHGGQHTIVCLLCFKDKIVVPTSLMKWIVQWYHYLLCHPGINRTEETISQHFYRPKMREQIMNDILTCMCHLSNSKETIQKVWTFAWKRCRSNTMGQTICQSHWSIWD